MGSFLSKEPSPLIGYDELKSYIRDGAVIINTLPLDEQSVLIAGTTPASREIEVVSRSLSDADSVICVYGRNCSDNSVFDKYKQLRELNAKNVYVYGGGMFEWLLLNDIYGASLFPTMGREPDILLFR